MSVIKFSISDFSKLSETAKKNTRIIKVVKYFQKTDDNTEGNMFIHTPNDPKNTIHNLFIHFWKANLFCYIAQYPQDYEDLGKELMKTKEFPKVSIYNKKQFLRKLKSLEYNLYTNDGNMFVSPKKYKLLKKIIECVSDELLDQILYPTER